MDASGRYVTPGLVDAHVHFSQTGWIDGRPDGLSAPDLYPYLETSRSLEADPGRWHRSYLCTGVTAVFDVGGHPWTTQLPEIAETSPDAAHVRAAGPLITHATRTALMADDEHYTFLPMDTPEEVRSSVARLVEMGSSAVKVWYLRPPDARREVLDERLMQVGEEARRAGLDLIVHATSLREAKMALRAGAKLLVHSVQDEFVDEEFTRLLRDNDGTYAPTLVVGANWTRAVAAFTMDLPPAVDDPGGCVDPSTMGKFSDTAALQALLPAARRSPEGIFRRFERGGASSYVMAENIRRVHDAGARVATATDAGNPMTLHGPLHLQRDGGHASSGHPGCRHRRHVHAKRRHRHESTRRLRHTRGGQNRRPAPAGGGSDRRRACLPDVDPRHARRRPEDPGRVGLAASRQLRSTMGGRLRSGGPGASGLSPRS